MNDKTLTFHRLSAPEVLGYPDVFVLKDSTRELIRGAGGTNPNPFNKEGVTWRTCFAQVACGTYKLTCWTSQRHGKCLTVNDGWNVLTTNRDVNSGEFYARSVEVHPGFGESNRGSVACFTIYMPLWADFIGFWELGETGKLIVTEDTI